MEKLLSVVIVLAISALLLVSGTYYGNMAYQDAKAEAYAQQIVSGAATIANAWRQWSKDNGGQIGLTDANWLDGTATDLVPNYLPALPKMPSPLINGSCTYFSPVKFTNWATVNCIGSNTPANSFVYVMSLAKGKRVCEKIAEISRGKGSALTSISSQGDLTSSLTSNSTFDCLYYTSTFYVFVYRVF